MSGSAERIAEDLAWLGLRYEAGTYVQSTRTASYVEAIDELTERSLVYPCDCSRSELAAVASAPHAGDELRYPGLCRDKDPRRVFKRPPALRLRVADGTRIGFVDQLTGTRVAQRVDREVGDFVLRRGDGVVAYQLAVALDDSAQGITHVVRGRDLLGSTARQLLLLELLARPAPAYWLHLPLVVMPDGERVAKRLRSLGVRDLRARGVEAAELVGVLAHGLGLAVDASPREADSLRLEPALASATLSRVSFAVPEAWASG